MPDYSNKVKQLKKHIDSSMNLDHACLTARQAREMLEVMDSLYKVANEWKRNFEEASASRDKALIRCEELQAFNEGILLGAEQTRKEYDDLRAVVRERYGPTGTKILEEVVSLRKTVKELKDRVHGV